MKLLSSHIFSNFAFLAGRKRNNEKNGTTEKRKNEKKDSEIPSQSVNQSVRSKIILPLITVARDPKENF